MDLLQTVRKEGSRGGRTEFKWEDVKNDSQRENYLGHSLMAPVGRWQKNRDLGWYAKGDNEDDQQSEADRIKEEKRKIKEAEEDAMLAAMGLPIPQRASNNANLTPLGGKVQEADVKKALDEKAAEEPEEEREKKSKHRSTRDRRDRDDDRKKRRRSRSRSRDHDRRDRDRRRDRSRSRDRRRDRSRSRDRRRDKDDGRHRHRSRSRERRRDDRSHHHKDRVGDHEKHARSRSRERHRRRSRSPYDERERRRRD